MNEAASKIKKWREDPVLFVREVFGCEPDPWQHEALEMYVKRQRLALSACKGPGKTCVLAWIAWHFLATRPHPKIAATSITSDNLGDGLWTEMAKWMKKSEFLSDQFVWTKTKIFLKASPETWWMSARTWSKTASKEQQADALAGLHAEYILFIMDESGGYPDAVMAAAEAALSTGTECRLIQAGNPTHLEGPLYRACTNEAHLWHVIHITGDPDDPKRSPRISPEWARQQIDKYGRDNPWVLVNVFGKFPPSSLNSLLGPNEVEAAMQRHYDISSYGHAQKRLGVDVARFGNDKTIIFPRQGLVAFKPAEMMNARTNDIVARIVQAKSKWNSEMEFVDGTGGYGAGVVDAMLLAGHSPMEVNFSEKAINNKYYNKRSEMWFEMANWIKRGGALPNIPELKRELTAPTYTFKNGRFLLEPKEQIKERLGVSPDMSDALALTFAVADMPARDEFEYIRKMGGGYSLQSDYDPFSNI